MESEEDRFARSLVAALREQIPGYARMPAEVLDGQVLASARAGVALFRALAAEWREPADDELLVFRESARARAGEGVPLDDVLRAYRLGAQLAWDELVSRATAAGERDALPATAATVLRLLDRLSSAVSETYLDERQYRLAEDARLVAELIDVLAADRPVPEGLRALATRLGSPILETYRPFALTRPGLPAAVHSQTAASLRLQGVLAMTEGEAVVGLADPEAEPAALTGGRGLLALGEPTRRAELRPALDDVRLLLAIARRRGRRDGTVDAVEFAVPLLVAGSPRLAAQVRRRVLGPLEAYEGGRSGEMLRSLRTYFGERLNRGRAATALGVHPNTLDYRLGRIEELCAVRLSDPHDIARIELALAQLDLEAS
jgi:hypothetical protein